MNEATCIWVDSPTLQLHLIHTDLPSYWAHWHTHNACLYFARLSLRVKTQLPDSYWTLPALSPRRRLNDPHLGKINDAFLHICTLVLTAFSLAHHLGPFCFDPGAVTPKSTTPGAILACKPLCLDKVAVHGGPLPKENTVFCLINTLSLIIAPTRTLTGW